MNFFAKIFVFIIGLSLLACGKEDSNSSSELMPTTPVNTTLTSKIIQPKISSDITLVNRSKINTINSLTSSSAVGQSLEVDVADVATQGLLIAEDGNNNPLLFSIEKDSAIGIDSTAYALVVTLMKFASLPDDTDIKKVQTNIRQVNSYSALKALLEQNLTNNVVSIDSPDVIKLASDVLNEAVFLSNSLLTVTATQETSKETVKMSMLSAKSNNNTNTLLPYYFFDKAATEKTWLSDADSSGLTLNNRTFLKWKIEVLNDNNQVVGKYYTDPMKPNSAQLLAYYGNSESKVKVPLALVENKFTISILQDAESQRFNAIRLVNKSIFAIVDMSLGIAGVKPSQVESCTLKVSDALVNSNEFTTAIFSTNASDWLAYLGSVAEKAPSLITKECNFHTSKGLGLENATSAVKRYFGRLSQALYVSRDVYGALAGFSQMNTYMNKKFSADFCFDGGEVTACSFWAGSYKITECNAPNAAGGSVANCNSTLHFSGGAGTSGGSIAFRTNSSEKYNFRRDVVLGGSTTISACYSESVTILHDTSSFVENIILGGDGGGHFDYGTMNYTITSKSPTLIKGEFSSSFPYIAYDANFNHVPSPVNGTVKGTWEASPTAKFPKCIPPRNYDSLSCADRNGGFGYGPYNETISCPYLPLYGTPRLNEWLP